MTLETDITPAFKKTSGKDAFDLKLVSDIIVQLNIVRKNTKMYPNGHPAMETSVNRALSFLDSHFAYADELAMAVTANSLIIGEQHLPSSHPIFAEFAFFLHEQSVYSICIKQGVTGDELVAANRILMGEDEYAPAKGETLQQKFIDFDVTAIELKVLSLDAADFMDKDVIDLDKELQKDVAGETSWEDYVRRLLQKGADDAFTMADDGIELTNVDPEKLAKFLNSLEKKKDDGLSYDKAVASYLQGISSSGQALGGVKNARVKADFVGLVNNLSLGLRSELLDSARNFSSRSQEVTAEVLDRKEAGIVLDTMEDLNKAQSRISPKMFELVDTLAAFDDTPAPDVEDDEKLTPEQTNVFAKTMQSFFSTSGFAKPPAVADRREFLKSLQKKSKDQEKGIDREFNESLAQIQYIRTMLDLLETAPDKKFAESESQILADLIAEYAESGIWDNVILIWKELTSMEAKFAEKNPLLSDFCRKARSQFWRPDNITLISEAILGYGVEKAEEMADMLRASGAECASQMVEALAVEEDEPVIAVLAGIVADLSEHTMKFVKRKLTGQPWKVVRNMLSMIQLTHDTSMEKKVEQLLESPRAELKLKALETLVMLDTSSAPALVIRHMRDTDPEVSLGAINIAGLVRNRHVNRELMDIITAKLTLAIDYNLENKLAAVRSLSMIRDNDCLKQLYKVASRKRFFKSADHARLRVEIFRSLFKYNSDIINDFIELGLGIGDAQIANMCNSLRRKMSGAKITI